MTRDNQQTATPSNIPHSISLDDKSGNHNSLDRRASFKTTLPTISFPRKRISKRVVMLRLRLIAIIISSVALLAYMSRQGRIHPTLNDMVNTMLVRPEHQEEPGMCDPTQGAGWVSEEGHWVRTDDACRSSQFIQRFRNTPQTLYTQEFPSFINKTMFVLGDSVGRQLWDQICAEIKAPKIVKTPEGVTPHVDYSEVSLCTQPELNFTVMAFHQYGFANATDPTTVGYLKKCFPGGPYDYHTRVTNLWNTMLKGFPEPDYISINGGAWDFLYMYNRDIIEKRFHQSVPEEDLAAFTGTLRGLLRFMSDMFPRSKIVWINVHPLNNEDLAAKHAWGGGYFQPPLDTTQDSVLFPPLFAQRRLTQHAQALRKTAAEEEVDSLDYWKLKDSFNSKEFWHESDTVHPNTLPRVAMVEMIFEKFHRFVEYGV